MSIKTKYKLKNYKKGSRYLIYKSLNKILIKKAYTDLAIQELTSNNSDISENDISFINENVYGIVRNKLKIDHIWSQFVTNEIKKEEIKNLLRLGTYQLIFLKGVKDHASIFETVELAKKLFGFKIANFINAVLRKIQNQSGIKNLEKIEIKNRLENVKINQSFPGWILRYWEKSYEIERVEEFCLSLNKIPRITLRVNTLKTNREKLIDLFKKENVRLDKTEFSPSGVILIDRANPAFLPYFKDGYFSVQDEAAQLITHLLCPRPDEKILDACSAPGGKSTHIAELMNNEGEIVSCDYNESRLNLVRINAKRLSVNNLKTFKADLTSAVLEQKYPDYFDKILLDAPCSGLGTIRRNPDLKWNREESDIKQLSDIQLKILNNISKTLKTNGIIVYSVCTISEEENEKVIYNFLENNKNFRIEKLSYNNYLKSFIFDDNFFISYPDLFDMDGFFAAKLKKIN
ncbi:MAG: 16S rRNA (cytosine(967)-C(5))-methyltransferase RsmB [Candidatus Dadabacteria bacterium]|nr:16S rRNA (cytosine(967)-C(5))-methyltransferase RsmB [Candidatus Dadabacteria bacterium]NIQ16836.1 16S rRNA (cytosine(967)-C(5))-methyltransferase RsmB [Candidatus Dadabacteria bacterium]